jgi:carnitine O-acetyltransferase
LQLDATGKVSLDHLYVQDDPRLYFATLRQLDYCIPQQAKPYFTKLIEEHRQERGVDVPTVLDIGCSYGVNAALLRCDATLDELYERYAGAGRDGLGREALIADDRAFVRSRRHLDRARFIGLDSSAPALAYARAAGWLDDAVHADLESGDPTDDEAAILGTADLVVSTGCLGYVTERTIRRIADACGDRRPWMAHFVLRMFPFTPVAETLGELGYESVKVGGVFRQRRFASEQEQALVLDGLAALGVDPRGLEADGWLYAQLHVSRPSGRGEDRGEG